MKRKKGNLKSQKGIVEILILAAIALPIFFAVFTFIIDVTFTHSARSTAQTMVDELCAIGARQLPFTGEVVEHIATQITNDDLEIVPYYSTITNFTVVSPTLNEDSTDPYEFPPSTPYVATPTAFSALGVTSDCTVCKFLGDTNDGSVVIHDTLTLDDLFPPEIMHPGRSNSIVGCFMNIEVNTFFMGKRQVRAVAASSIRVAGDPLPPPTIIGTDPEYRGVIMAIVPHMQTRNDVSTDEGVRFVFDKTVNFFDDYSPHALPYPKAYQWENPKAGTTGIFGGKDFFEISDWGAYTGNDKVKERLTNCANTFAIARNALAESFMQRFMRWANTRTQFQLLIPGTYRDFPPPPPGGGPAIIAPMPKSLPSVVIRYGEDVAKREYWIPRIAYARKDHNNDIYYPCPFDNTTGFLVNCDRNGGLTGGQWAPIDDESREESRLVIDQLRDCYTIYNDNGKITMQDYSLYDTHWTNFEAATFRSFNKFEPDYADGERWSQPMDDNYRLNGPELVSVLGSIQRCPVAKVKAAPNQWCDKGSIPQYSTTADNHPNVRADIISILDFALADDAPTKRKAVEWPNQLYPEGHTITQYENGEAGHSIGSSAMLIIFLHERLDPTKVDDIRKRVDKMTAKGRPIRIIMIPSNVNDFPNDDSGAPFEHRDEMYEDFREAFDLGAGTPPPIDALHKLFIIGQPNVETLADCGGGVYPAEGKCMRDYIQDFLNPSGNVNNYIETIADSIFWHQIAHSEKEL